jgi:hypothetical protein
MSIATIPRADKNSFGLSDFICILHLNGLARARLLTQYFALHNDVALT